MKLTIELIVEGWKGLPESGHQAFQVTINFWNYFSLRRFFDTYQEAKDYDPKTETCQDHSDLVRQFAKEGYLSYIEAFNPIIEDYDTETLAIIDEHVNSVEDPLIV